MKSFVDKLWTRISLEKPIFTDREFCKFYEDFSKMMDDFWFSYHSFSLSAMQKMVEEKQSLFEKLADILVYEPKFFMPSFIQSWLFGVFETGKMPRAGEFVFYLNWNEELIAPLVVLYIKDEKIRSWTATHWNICQKYRYNILWALHEENIFDYNLFNAYNPHFFKQFFVFILLSGGLVWLHIYNYLPLVLFLFIMVPLGYWILTELFFTILCCKIKAFW